MSEDRFSIENAGRSNEPAESAVSDSARREARRRVLAGGLASAPLVLTLASRPALASHCSISGMTSGNLSSTHDVVCEGRTPGYWKTHEQQCSRYIIIGPCNPINDNRGQCDDYSVPSRFELEQYLAELQKKPEKNRKKIEDVEAYLAMLDAYPGLDSPPFGTSFAEVFGPGLTEEPATTMMHALWLDDTPPLPPEGAGGPSPVLAHSAAAWLNANEFGPEAYGLSPERVIELVNEMILTDPLGLKSMLETLNSRA